MKLVVLGHNGRHQLQLPTARQNIKQFTVVCLYDLGVMSIIGSDHILVLGGAAVAQKIFVVVVLV